MTEEWPFAQPRDCAVITLRQILEGLQSILHVSRDRADDSWQFLGLEDARVEDASVVSFEEVVELDPSILQLADLPPGWHAWRKTIKGPWSRGPTPSAE
jgi:hypothetical protein